ncbi:MAG: TIGR04076 family protein [Prolixibacteraceae bacterium]|nr:TIGR04076 family protein [Prolixibacteraceae bacterium]
MAKCKITVLKKIFNKELVAEYSNLDLSDQCLGCPHFAVNEEFLVEDHNHVPEGFCSWAWGDIQKDLTTIMFDGSFPWMKEKGVSIACCSDGLMPVVFKIEKIQSDNLNN